MSGVKKVRPPARSRRDEHGVVTVVVAVFMSGMFFALAAISVDVARWYMEVERVQKAADAGALAGVTHMPQDLGEATATARDVSGRNGYPHSGTTSVTAEAGARPSQLKVAVSSTISNTFGSMFGVDTIKITRSAVADYNGPAPMGSPCNVFGNEPTSGAGSAAPVGSALPPLGQRFAGCDSKPDFWATIEGPQTEKLQGDRYSTRPCGSGTIHECGSGGNPPNREHRKDGYYWMVRVTKAAVGNPIKLQLYDPGYVGTGAKCENLPNASSLSGVSNPYVPTGANVRYAKPVGDTDPAREYCTGDYDPGTKGSHAMTTTFVLRDPVDTLNPAAAPVHQGCVRQYRGMDKLTTAQALNPSSSGNWQPQLASYFHTWTDFCTFTPDKAGDYYLQVRSNVAAPGYTSSVNNGKTQLIYDDNPAASAPDGNSNTGSGNNAFGIRAVTAPGLEDDVAVSGYARMPIFANAPSARSTFNLIRVLPAAAGKSIKFSFYDASDCIGTCAGTVQVKVPQDSSATTPFGLGCKSYMGSAAATVSTLTDCKAPVTFAKNNGKLQTMSIPIPADYTCNYMSFGGCWYQVEVAYTSPANAQVTDITTWDASIAGDPVRLTE